MLKTRYVVRVTRASSGVCLELSYHARPDCAGHRSIDNAEPIILWNSLPSALRDIQIHLTFKRHLKAHSFRLFLKVVWVGGSHTSILTTYLKSTGLFTTGVKFSSNSIQPLQRYYNIHCT